MQMGHFPGQFWVVLVVVVVVVVVVVAVVVVVVVVGDFKVRVRRGTLRSL